MMPLYKDSHCFLAYYPKVEGQFDPEEFVFDADRYCRPFGKGDTYLIQALAQNFYYVLVLAANLTPAVKNKVAENTNIERIQKYWGTAERLYNNGIVRLDRAIMRAGGYSSWHSHALMDNYFFCNVGDVVVKTKDTGENKSWAVSMRQYVRAEAGVVHQMAARSDAWVYELYLAQTPQTPQLLIDDIHRLDSGGMLV